MSSLSFKTVKPFDKKNKTLGCNTAYGSSYLNVTGTISRDCSLLFPSIRSPEFVRGFVNYKLFTGEDPSPSSLQRASAIGLKFSTRDAVASNCARYSV